MTTTTPDLASFRRAIETRNAAEVLAWYHDDAVITLVDRDHPPASPMVLHGAAEISAYYTDICGRNIEHRLDQLVHDDGGLGYVQLCRYPDGGQVTCAAVATVKAGRIERQTIVQAWDS